eukprot:Colp12_sorted_trinity150504_noHs@19053
MLSRIVLNRVPSMVASMAVRAYAVDAARIAAIKDRLKPLGKGEVHLQFLHEHPRVAVITLDNPQRRNALSGHMMARFAEHVDTLEKWDGTGVILQGAQNTFCSGADLSVAKDYLSTSEAGQDMCYFMQDTLTRFRRLPIISVAAIEGNAIGGGAELATACDHRIIGDDGLIHFVHTRMGVITGWGGAARLIRIVGRQNALRILAGGEPMTVAKALKTHLVDNAVPSGTVYESALDFLKLYSVAPPHCVKAAKDVLAFCDDASLEKGNLEEARLFGKLWGGEENQNAINRFKSSP